MFKANEDKSITIAPHSAGTPNELNTLVFVLDVNVPVEWILLLVMRT